jgi:glycosyltransferase involved in cell wall biosynthesis
VPAFNEERLLGESLRRIRAAAAAFERRGWAWELIVCDNNSSDRTAAVARAAGARVVFEPVNQIARARNTGATAAAGEWLLFIDADSHPSEALLDDVASEIERGGTLAGGATVRFDSGDWRVRAGAATWNAISRTTQWAAGSFIFCEAGAFRRLGGFSQELYAGEEIDLFRRLKRLARQASLRIVILSLHPLTTSSRKLHLYDWRDMVRMAWRSVLSPRRALRSADACYAWYDGRR